MSMDSVRLIGAVRTPIAAQGGIFHAISAPLLAAPAIGALGEATGLKGEQVSQLFLGSVFGAGLGPNPAQRSLLHAGLDSSVLASSIRAGAGSSLVALHLAARSLEGQEVAIVGGADSSSTQPYLLPGARRGSRLGASRLVDGAYADSLTGEDDVPLNVTAEIAAQRLGISEEELEEYIAKKRAALEAAAKPRAPIELMVKRDVVRVTADGALGPRKSRFLAPLADGAAMLALGRGEGFTGPKLIGWARAGTSANRTPLAPLAALRELMTRLGRPMTDLRCAILDESFAVAPLAAKRELRLSDAQINPLGGAMSRGFPGGACSAVALVDLYEILSEQGGLGAVAYGTGTGGSIALAFEHVQD